MNVGLQILKVNQRSFIYAKYRFFFLIDTKYAIFHKTILIANAIFACFKNRYKCAYPTIG